MAKETLLDIVGELASGETVYDRPRSHMKDHADTQLEKFVPLALRRIESKNKEFVVATIDFGVEIGATNCVKTEPGDEVVFVQREGRNGETRFVKGKSRTPTSMLTVVLKKTREGYLLITAYFGPKAPPEPWDPHAEADSEEFWNTHALVIEK